MNKPMIMRVFNVDKDFDPAGYDARKLLAEVGVSLPGDENKAILLVMVVEKGLWAFRKSREERKKRLLKRGIGTEEELAEFEERGRRDAELVAEGFRSVSAVIKEKLNEFEQSILEKWKVGKYFLGEATRDILCVAATSEEKSAGGHLLVARFYRTIAEKVPEGATVRDVLTAAEVDKLREEVFGEEAA